MASELYGELAEAATELLQELGQPVSLRRTTGGVYNRATGRDEGATTVSWPASGVEFDYAAREIDGKEILRGDRRVLISPDLGTMPEPQDVVVLETGVMLQVVRSKPLQPAGVVVLHEVQVRGVS